MKPAYAPDNTRSSVVVVLLLGVAACLVALLVGLSDKPDVTTIGIAAGSASSPATVAETPAAEAMMASGDDTGEAMTEDATAAQDSAAALSADEQAASDGSELGVTVPTAEPTATPEVAAAVAPTPAPSTAPEASTAQAADSAALPASGSVEGTFFTRADEDKGATVARNSITVSFNEDGSGSFTGSLDITYADKTHISLQMSGPLNWSTAPPQVEATVSGSFEIDAPIATDDVSVDKAELSITSLESGSGSLCATKCFGFTFPPQNRL